MATEIKPIVRPWDSSAHHSIQDLHAKYSAQSSAWRNGRGPTFEEVGEFSSIENQKPQKTNLFARLFK